MSKDILQQDSYKCPKATWKTPKTRESLLSFVRTSFFKRQLEKCSNSHRHFITKLVLITARSYIRPLSVFIALNSPCSHHCPAAGDFRIWTRFLRRYVYFRVISIHFNPYCMHAHCMICCTLTCKLPPGVLNDTRPRLVER